MELGKRYRKIPLFIISGGENVKRSAKGNILLFMAAIIWGCALVAQKAGMSHLGPFGFTAIRCTLGGLVLLPLIWHLDKKKTDEEKDSAEV